MHKHADLVVAISPDNVMLHVASSDRLRTHFEESAPEVQRTNAADAAPELVRMDYYDSLGHPLTADLTRRKHGKRPSGSPSSTITDEAALLTRIDAVLTHMQAMLDEHPELGDTGPDTPRITEVPRPEGSLPEVVEQLATLFGIEGLRFRNKGNWWHMMAHAAGNARH